MRRTESKFEAIHCEGDRLGVGTCRVGRELGVCVRWWWDITAEGTRTSQAKEVVDGIGGDGNVCAARSSSGSSWLWRNWESERGVRASDGLSLKTNACRGRSAAPVAVDSESGSLHSGMAGLVGEGFRGACEARRSSRQGRLHVDPQT